MKIIFTVPGEAIAKAAPRAVYNEALRRSIIYTPNVTASFQNFVKLVASRFFEKPFGGPVALTARFYRKIPKSFSKKDLRRIEAGKLWPVTKPDCTNYTKSLEDGLRKIAFYDDNQVVELHVLKFFSDHPRVEVEVEALETEEAPPATVAAGGSSIQKPLI